jgi:hypothetical protein
MTKKRKMTGSHTVTTCIFPPLVDGKQQPDSVEIVESEMFRLDEGEFLNDSLIGFDLKYLHMKARFRSDYTPDQKIRADDFYFFSPYFLARLVSFGLLAESVPKDDKNAASWNIQLKKGFNLVKKWTKHVNIFEKKFLFIPVNADVHWSVVVVCNPGLIEMEKESADTLVGAIYDDVSGKCGGVASTSSVHSIDEREVPAFVCMDSLKCHPKEQICEILRKYLEMEWKCQKARDEEAAANADKEAPEALGPNAETSKSELLPLPSPATVGKEDESSSNAETSSKEETSAKEESSSKGKPTSARIRGPCRAFRKGMVPAEITKQNLPNVHPEVPTQENMCDCGVFLLKYVEWVFREHVERGPLRITQAHVDSKLKNVVKEDMFTRLDIKRKRVEMEALLRNKEPEWNLWKVDWAHELETQKRWVLLEPDDDDKGDGEDARGDWCRGLKDNARGDGCGGLKDNAFQSASNFKALDANVRPLPLHPMLSS